MRKETKQNGDILGKTQYSPTTDVEIVVNLQWRYHGEIETLWGDHGDTARLHYGHLNGSILGSWGSPPKRGKSLKTWRKFWGRTSSNGGFLFFEVTFPGPCRAHKVWPWLEIHHLKKSLSPNSCTLLEFCGILFKGPVLSMELQKKSIPTKKMSSSSLSSRHHRHHCRHRHCHLIIIIVVVVVIIVILILILILIIIIINQHSTIIHASFNHQSIAK